jgi:SAM-dependent methyltransferase
MTVLFDNGGNFPDMESARAYVQGSSSSNTSAAYHKDRMRALKILAEKIDCSRPLRVHNFGCGDSMEIKELFPPTQIANLVGFDISPAMIELSKDNLQEYNFQGFCCGVEGMSTLENNSIDLFLAIDVMGYLSPSERDLYYSSLKRVGTKGAYLLVMTGNELFDMYALNAGTVQFFDHQFEVDVTTLLTEASALQYKPSARRNPLSSSAELLDYGFKEVDIAYSQWHRIPPALGNKTGKNVAEARMLMRDHNFNPNNLAPNERWKAMFRSSIFASLSQSV